MQQRRGVGLSLKSCPDQPSGATPVARSTAARLSPMKARCSSMLIRLVMRRVAWVPWPRKVAPRRAHSSTSSGMRRAASAPSATLGTMPAASSASNTRKMPIRLPYSRME
jgi:hypothetical protein